MAGGEGEEGLEEGGGRWGEDVGFDGCAAEVDCGGRAEGGEEFGTAVSSRFPKAAGKRKGNEGSNKMEMR